MTRVAVKHRFTASAERVYDAWLDPAKMRKFLYTTATGEIVRCDVDGRVGGKYAIIDRRNGEDVLHEGTYLELEHPIAARLRVAADRMSAQRGLPMGTHDQSKWTDAHMKAFARFVHEQGALASLLRVAAERDEQMLASMQKKSE